MSLRLRLLIGLAVLVLGGLTVFGASTYLSLDHFLVGKLDDQLTTAASSLASSPRPLGRDGDGQPGQSSAPTTLGSLTPTTVGSYPRFPSSSDGGVPPGGIDDNFVRGVAGPDLYVVTLDAQGHTVHVTPSNTQNGAGAPTLTAALRTGRIPSRGTTVTAVDSSKGNERIAVAPLQSGGRVVVAGSLRPVTQTLHRLLLIEGSAGGAVILVTIMLGLALARTATKPLEEIAVTADAIGAGDLDQRVEVRAPRTEAGRVGQAFNAMLTEIQQSFARRDATEARLRRFVADASHELSTPLTSIRGYAELFHRGLAEHPEDLATAMGRIESESIRMGRLVDDLLLLAKIDSGRPVELRPVDLSSIVADAAADLRVVAPDWPVTVVADAPVVVSGDEDRLRQVVANLTSNAHRYTPAGTSITLRSSIVGDRGVVEVADQGAGLTEEQAAKVFDRFYRVDTARSRAEGGSGLGLAIVASITEAMGGTATVDTEPGGGTTFRIAVPLA